MDTTSAPAGTWRELLSPRNLGASAVLAGGVAIARTVAAAPLVITGSGIGIAWPHLSAWAMSRVDDPAEGPAAAAAINSVQLMCGAFGAGLAGVVVNTTDTGGAHAAHWLFGVFAVLAALGALASFRTSNRAER